MEKIFGIVILYQPDKNILYNVSTYLPMVEKLMIVDNSEQDVDIDFNTLGDKVLLVKDGINKGISERLNTAADWCVTNGAQWLLTMDQDSFFEKEMMQQYLACFAAQKNKQLVAMYGVEFEKKKVEANCDHCYTDLLITSGSIVNVPVCKKIGGFNIKLFIDEVDAEYCIRASASGYKTVKFLNILLNHNLGTIHHYRSFKNLKKTVRVLHSPLRVYYMVRNYLYIKHTYKKNLPASMATRKQALLNRVKNNFLYGKKRFQLIQYLFLAWLHYKRGKMGKLENTK